MIKKTWNMVRARPWLVVAALLLGVYVSVLGDLQPTVRAADLGERESAPGQGVATASRGDGETGGARSASTHDPQSPADGLSDGFLAAYDQLAGQAASGGLAEQQAVPENGNLVWILFTFLLIFAGAAYGGVFLWRRYHGVQGAGRAPGGKLLAVQESHALSANQSLHLVRMGEEMLLIGATDHHISLLARLDGETLPMSFASHLHEAAQKGAAVAPAAPLHASPARPSLNLGERLQALRSIYALGGKEEGHDQA